MRKTLIILIAAAIILVGGGFYWWQINKNTEVMKPFDSIQNLGFSVMIPERFNIIEPESEFGYSCETEDNDPDAGIIRKQFTDNAEMETKLEFAVVNTKKCIKMPIRFPERNLITDESFERLIARTATDPFFGLIEGKNTKIPIKVSSETAGPVLSAFIYMPDHIYPQAHISWSDPAIMSLSWKEHDYKELWADIINADADKLPKEAIRSIKEFHSILETIELTK